MIREMPHPKPEPPRPLELLLVLAVAAWARFAVAPRVLLERVSPGDGDSEYHLRRILLAWENFPRLSVFDPLLGWPQGAAHPWAPGFDWVAAAALHLTGLRDPGHLALAASCFPVLLGLLTVATVIAITRQLLPAGTHRAAALGAGLVASLVPQFLGATRVARTDHHAWEAASLALLLWWALRSLEDHRPARIELVGALIVTGALAGFTGAPLYVALVLPLLLSRLLLFDGARPLWGSGAAALTVGAFANALINLGPISEHGRWLSFGYPSLLQPALLLGAAGAVTLAWGIGRWLPLGRWRLGAFALCLAGGTLVALALPGLGAQVRGGLVEWVFKKDPWLSGVSEFQPLFAMGRGPVEAVLYYFGFAGLAAPVLLAGAWRGHRERPMELAGFTFVFVALGALTLLQMRTGRVWGPLLGVALVLGLENLARRWPRFGGLAAGVALVVLSAADPEVRRALLLAEPRDPSPLEAMADSLRLERHAERGRGDGVLASWDLGHTLLSRAGRPVIASGFGTYVDRAGFEASAAAFEGNESALLETMTERDLGLVVTGAAQFAKLPGAAPILLQSPSGLSFNPPAAKRHPLAVLSQGGSGLVGAAPHVEHLMPVRASDEMLANSALPHLWAYERVAGFTLTRACAPGQLLVAQLPAKVGDRPFQWVAWTTCGPGGIARLVLCVPTGVTGAGFSTAPEWSLSTAGRPTEGLPLSRLQIRRGEEG